MHPEIKKFWEATGHPLYGSPSSIIGIWELHIHVGGPLSISRIEIVCHGDKHRFQNKWYSEEEMLAIIKLIAFA